MIRFFWKWTGLSFLHAFGLCVRRIYVESWRARRDRDERGSFFAAN